MFRWIKFSVKYRVQGAGGPTYLEGQVEKMPIASCRHFVSREVAEFCDPPVSKSAVKADPVTTDDSDEGSPDEKEPKAEPPAAPKPRKRSRKKR